VLSKAQKVKGLYKWSKNYYCFGGVSKCSNKKLHILFPSINAQGYKLSRAENF
jgi:hypothetical protein